MNAVINGKSMPVADALSYVRKQMLACGITRPRVRIGSAYVPPPPPTWRNFDQDMDRLQTALIGG